MTQQNPFDNATRRTLAVGDTTVAYYSLKELAKQPGLRGVSRLPLSIKVLLEAALRQCDNYSVSEADVRAIAGWSPKQKGDQDIPFKPARVVLQDFTGVPTVVDLATMRDAVAAELGGDPRVINPVLDVDLVIDHSVQVDAYASAGALGKNTALEFQRNRERYEFLKWGAGAFANFRVVPPATGIVHQVNLEYLATGVRTRIVEGQLVAFPDSLVGTDSHTTMINGIGILGWGVGGIEAEAVMLDQPMSMVLPEVVGFKLTGRLPEGATATDLVLRVTEMLRKFGVVGKFVEFFGAGLSNLPVPDRATIANMAPEYGATCGFFPVDQLTLEFMKMTNRSASTIALLKAYSRAQGLFRTDTSSDPKFTAVLELDLGTVKPAIAGPKRPQDRVDLDAAKDNFRETLAKSSEGKIAPAKLPATPGARTDHYRDWRVSVTLDGETVALTHGSVVIAAITSCTNTSNPGVLLAAGLLAKNAVAAGLAVPRTVKTSLAPGSRVVTRYLEAAGVQPYLQALGFHVVGYGCTTCIGNSGPLRPEIAKAIQDHGLTVASVLSGNRNFEGRVHADVRANYLASPPLVVAYALAGTVDIDFAHEPIGFNHNGDAVYLRDLWPSSDDIRAAVATNVTRKLFAEEYADVFAGSAEWKAIAAPAGERYTWNARSTYIAKPPYFQRMGTAAPGIAPLHGARALAVLGDSVTTDHISPAGSIKQSSPAGQWLVAQGVQPADFNQYGARRGHHEVMMRGTFANTRIRNRMVPGVEGGVTMHVPSGEQMPIYDAAMKYVAAGTPLVILAGKEYGTGSSRDWAAKGTALLGVRAVIAESFERIHRSNLVGMGVLPLEFLPGDGAEALGLTGREVYDVIGLGDALQPKQKLEVVARGDGGEKRFIVTVRVDTPVEIDYLKHGGILQAVLRKLGQPAATGR